MANYRNEYEFRSGLLDALGVEHTEADAKNEERWRAKMLDGLEVEYNQNDVNQFDLFRAKLVEGVEAKAEGEGGVTNTKKVVTGTLADPFGDIDVADLCSKLQTMDATAYLSVNASSLGQGTLESRPYADSTRFRTNSATMSNTVANTKAYGFDWNISSKELTFANVQNNNQMLDIMSYASGLTTTLTVIYHPISE